MSETAQLTENTIDALDCAGQAIERQHKLLSEKQAAEQRALALVSKAAQAVLASGAVDGTQADELRRTLSDHEKALAFLTKLAALHAQSAAEVREENGHAVGRPHGRGKSAADGVGPYCGVRTARMSPADRAYFESLGVAVPADA